MGKVGKEGVILVDVKLIKAESLVTCRKLLLRLVTKVIRLNFIGLRNTLQQPPAAALSSSPRLRLYMSSFTPQAIFTRDAVSQIYSSIPCSSLPCVPQDGKTLENELEVVEGMKFDRGYISPYFITDQKTMKAELDNPLILIVEKKISGCGMIIVNNNNSYNNNNYYDKNDNNIVLLFSSRIWFGLVVI